MAAGKPLRLRMQVRSFDAVCHLVASGLGVALLPREAVLPLLNTLPLTWRPLSDAWAQRRLLIGHVTPDDAAVALVHFLTQPSPTAKARQRKQQ
jgi:DNA-binding transcriptional LysR family regulator